MTTTILDHRTLEPITFQSLEAFRDWCQENKAEVPPRIEAGQHVWPQALGFGPMAQIRATEGA